MRVVGLSIMKENISWELYERYNYIIRYLKYRRNQVAEKVCGHEYWPLPNYEAGKKLLSLKKTNELIGEYIEIGNPAWVGRMGGTEMNMIFEVLKHRFHPEYDNRAHAVECLCELSGFFPNDIEMGDRFVDLMLSCCGDIDLQAAWGRYMADFIYKKYQKNTILTGLDRIEPWNMYKSRSSVLPWSHALKGKKVLVIHPFAESIERQYLENRTRIFKNIYDADNILPEFELHTIKAVQTLAGEKDARFKDWFEALDWMTEECRTKVFDVAIIGCGAYGYPLASRIKAMGKCAIHLAGATQLLFGITGRRWEVEHIYKDFRENVINEYWIRPDARESIVNKDKVEDACYW